MAHHTAANRLSLPHTLHAPIHQLLVHQSEPKPSMWQGCFYDVIIFDLGEENVQLFFDKARQTRAHRPRFSAPWPAVCPSVFPAYGKYHFISVTGREDMKGMKLVLGHLLYIVIVYFSKCYLLSWLCRLPSEEGTLDCLSNFDES